MKKKQDYCFEISTAERNWYFWALDKESMTSWIEAFEMAKKAGRAAKGASATGPVEMPAEANRSSKLSGLLKKGEEDDIDYISSEDDEVRAPDSANKDKKRAFVRQAYSKDVEKIQLSNPL